MLQSSGAMNKYVSKSGNHGSQWQFLQLQVSTYNSGTVTLVIEGVRGVSYLGDIAIDDIRVLPSSQCPNQS